MWMTLNQQGWTTMILAALADCFRLVQDNNDKHLSQPAESNTSMMESGKKKAMKR